VYRKPLIGPWNKGLERRKIAPDDGSSPFLRPKSLSEG
jgi:hypothetical protein